jgi:hypothetical protein
VTHSVHARIEELIRHHEVRLDAAAQQVRAGASTSWEVACGIKWTRREKRLEDLEDISQMLAVLEIEAHLDVLADQEVLRGAVDNGVRVYAVA